MWIEMKHTYAGGIGCFNKGVKYDLPPGTVKLIPKDCYKETCPPWDEQMDKPAVALQDARAAAQAAADVVTQLEREIDSAKTNIEQLGHRGKAGARQLDQARGDAKRLANIAENKAKAIAKAKGEAEAKAAAEAEAEAEEKAAAEAAAKAKAEAEKAAAEGQATTGPGAEPKEPGFVNKMISKLTGGSQNGKTEGPKQGQAGPQAGDGQSEG